MSTKPKMTPWFGNGEKPVREGVYQQKSGDRPARLGYQRWLNGEWMTWHSTFEEAAEDERAVHGSYQNDPWRGLAEKP